MAQLQERIDYTGGSNPVYVGETRPGSSLQSLKWRIKKLTYSGNNLIRSSWANGNAQFNKRWDNRTSYTYV